MSWFQPAPTVLIYQSNDFPETDGKLAIFDMDWTLIRPIHGKFPKDPTDVALLRGRKDVLDRLIRDGYTIVIVSNQMSPRGKGNPDDVRAKIEYVARMIGTPIIAFAATGDDEYRKPRQGIWKIIQEMFQQDDSTGIKEAFFVGDAAGRRQDFSDSDKEWARQAGIAFKTPEEVFPSNIPIIPTGPTLVILAGVPGSGKSTLYQKYLQPAGYIHVSQDVLGTRKKVLSTVEKAMQSRQPVAVDATNPSQEGREEFYALAKKYGYNVNVFYLVREGHGWNALREHPVPAVAYSSYYKRLEEPTEENTPGRVYQIWY